MAARPVIRLADAGSATPARRSSPDHSDGEGRDTRRPLAPASRAELVPRSRGRAVRLAAASLSTALSLAAVGAMTDVGDHYRGAVGLLLWLVPMAVVLLTEIATDRAASNPAADLVNALRTATAGLAAMLVLIPATVGGSGLRVGVHLWLVLVPTRWVLAGVARAVLRSLTHPVTVVALCDEADFAELDADMAQMRFPVAAGSFPWHEVFPDDMDTFRRQWLLTAGKVWNPADLVIVFTVAAARSADALGVFSELEDLGARVILLDSFYEAHLGRTRVTGDELLLGHRTTEVSTGFRLLKATTDMVVGVMGLTLLVVIGPVAAALIKTGSPGPVFYRQERLGLRGRTFTVLKFRTMREPTAGEPAGAAPDEGRITRVGRLLRRSRLDELPQVWNILRREMSLVGPRPERPEVAAMLDASIPAYHKRLLVRPGLTGWAQVNEGYAVGLDEHRRKLERDLYYLRHRSATLDLQCITRTLSTVVRLKGV